MKGDLAQKRRPKLAQFLLAHPADARELTLRGGIGAGHLAQGHIGEHDVGRHVELVRQPLAQFAQAVEQTFITRDIADSLRSRFGRNHRFGQGHRRTGLEQRPAGGGNFKYAEFFRGLP